MNLGGHEVNKKEEAMRFSSSLEDKRNICKYNERKFGNIGSLSRGTCRFGKG